MPDKKIALTKKEISNPNITLSNKEFMKLLIEFIEGKKGGSLSSFSALVLIELNPEKIPTILKYRLSDDEPILTMAIRFDCSHVSDHLIKAILLSKKNKEIMLEKPDKLGNTALMIASAYGRVNIVKMLLKAGGNVKAENTQGATALVLAAFNNCRNVMTVLLKHDENLLDAKINKKYTALYYAVTYGNLTAVEALMFFGASLNVVFEEGLTINQLLERRAKSEFKSPQIFYKIPEILSLLNRPDIKNSAKKATAAILSVEESKQDYPFKPPPLFTTLDKAGSPQKRQKSPLPQRPAKRRKLDSEDHLFTDFSGQHAFFPPLRPASPLPFDPLGSPQNFIANNFGDPILKG